MAHPLSRHFCHPKLGQVFELDGEEYVIEGAVGTGAAGIVRKASRKRDKRQFAVKFLAPDPKYIEESVFDDVAARFRREGERGAKLDHPHLLRLYSYVANPNGEAFRRASGAPKNPFILMECIRGRTLEHLIRKEALQDAKTLIVTPAKLKIGIAICDALSYLHRKKLIHRDVKPANIFVSGGANLDEIKLGDFGIVKWGDFHASLATGALTATAQQGLGTLKYMSPEQAVRPKDVTTKSDIYSLGITLFELLTGQILASPHHVFEIMNARLIRGTTASRYHEMGYRISDADVEIAELLLDMHLRGISGRPTVDKVMGRLQYEAERGSPDD